MCHWGMAYNYGLNINRPISAMDSDRIQMAVYHASLTVKYSPKIHRFPELVGLTNAMYVYYVYLQFNMLRDSVIFHFISVH